MSEYCLLKKIYLLLLEANVLKHRKKEQPLTRQKDSWSPQGRARGAIRATRSIDSTRADRKTASNEKDACLYYEKMCWYSFINWWWRGIMYRRSYTPHYQSEALDAIKTHEKWHTYVKKNWLSHLETTYWFCIANTQPYDRCRDQERHWLHITRFEKSKEQLIKKDIEMATIVRQYQKLGGTIQRNGERHQSVSNILHFHIFSDNEL